MLTIAFDFDGTLNENTAIQKLCKKLRSTGLFKLLVITRRYGNNAESGEDFYRFLAEYGFKREDIHCTNRVFKDQFVDRLGVDILFDNDMYEVSLVNSNCKCIAIQATNVADDDYKKIPIFG